MTKLKLTFLLLIVATMLGCSSDDDSSSDIIIGKWRPIARFESNVQVDLSTCEPHFYTEYRADKSILSDRIITNEFPEECGIVATELGWNWRNLGNSQYRIRYLEEQGTVVKIYRDGENLVIESLDGVTRTVMEPF